MLKHRILLGDKYSYKIKLILLKYFNAPKGRKWLAKDTVANNSVQD